MTPERLQLIEKYGSCTSATHLDEIERLTQSCREKDEQIEELRATSINKSHQISALEQRSLELKAAYERSLHTQEDLFGEKIDALETRNQELEAQIQLLSIPPDLSQPHLHPFVPSVTRSGTVDELPPEDWRPLVEARKKISALEERLARSVSSDDYEKCLSSYKVKVSELAVSEARFVSHTKAVEQFLSDMLCTMVDPLADGISDVAKVCDTLLRAATEQRQREYEKDASLLKLRTALTNIVDCMNRKGDMYWQQGRYLKEAEEAIQIERIKGLESMAKCKVCKCSLVSFCPACRGRRSSEVKKKSSRENGKLGGRPVKK